MKLRSNKKGAVSLYIVLFATLLVTVIALGFTRIMLNERRQVSDTDLSQTAYDSAMAGIEDAKLAVLRYNECLSNPGQQYPTSGSTTRTCDDIISVMRNGQPLAGDINICDGVPYILGRQFSGETPIQEGGAGNNTFDQTDQAYTCVRVSDATTDFLSTFDAHTRSRLIPLRTDGQEFNQIVISWSRPRNGVSASSLGSPPPNVNPPISFPADWPANTPPVLSASIIQSGTTFQLSHFETANGSTNTNRASMILVPVASGGSNTIAAASVAQTNDQLQNNPFPINCITPVGGAYACSVTITLPDPINNTTRHDGTAFLILESIYLVGTHDFQVRVQRDGAAVPLVGVQVAVDSTGRNADSLRRIEGRIEVVDTAYPYPEWTVQLNGASGASFCKNFIVTINNWVVPGQDLYDRSSC